MSNFSPALSVCNNDFQPDGLRLLSTPAHQLNWKRPAFRQAWLQDLVLKVMYFQGYLTGFRIAEEITFRKRGC